MAREISAEAESAVVEVLKKWDGLAPPSNALLASRAGLSQQHVSRILRSLEERGMVVFSSVASNGRKLGAVWKSEKGR